MDFSVPEELNDIRAAVRELCDRFPGEYWRALEPDRYPEEFVAALTEHGWLAALIPEEYGGAGLSLTAASVILEEINATGCNAGACHAQMDTMGTIPRHDSDPDGGAAVGRRLRRARPEDLDVQGAPLRPDAAPGANDAHRGGREEDGGTVDVHRGHEASAGGGDDDHPPDPHADEPRDH